MATYRIPGPQGFSDSEGLVWHRSPFDVNRWIFTKMIPACTLGPAGTNGDPGAELADVKTAVALADAESDAKELKLLQDVYGVLSKDGKAYRRPAKKGKKHGKLTDDVEAYVKHRNAFFGSAASYRESKEKAIQELEANKAKLRKFIEPNLAERKRKKQWKDAQNVFYAWVRRAYELNPNVPEGADIPKVIASHSSEKLQKALAKVRVDYGKPFQAGGFNPRPMKLSGRYRLGTLSEHAIGNAIDIDAAKNAQIPAATWGHILKFTGKSLDHATRKSKWKTDPQGLYESVKGINDEFVQKLKEALQKAEKAADPVDAAMTTSDDLKKIGKKFLTRWRDGFLSLEWSLVQELREEGFTWGASFPDPDLHHFEL